MLANAILKHPRKTEWGVVDPRMHVRKNERVVGLISRGQTRKATIVSTKFYRNTSRIAYDQSGFYLADTADRAKGFLMTDGVQFWVSPSADFVAPYAECEAPWLIQEEKDRVEQEKRAAEAERHDRAREYGFRRAEDRAKGALHAIQSILGDSAASAATIRTSSKVEHDKENDRYIPKITGVVSLTIQDWERLMEKYADLLENQAD